MLAHILTTGLAVAFLLPSPGKAGDAPEGDKDLAGQWKLVSVLKDGEELLRVQAEVFFDFGSDSWVVRTHGEDGDHAGGQVVIKVDATKTPKAIDIPSTSADGKSQAALWIYEVMGDDLRICSGDGPGKDRPTEFSGKKGSGWVLWTLKRVKK